MKPAFAEQERFEDKKPCTCDRCYFKAGHVLGADECGAGNWAGYCAKGYWDGLGPDEAEWPVEDVWKDCKDFIRLCECCSKKPVAGYIGNGTYIDRLCRICWRKGGDVQSCHSRKGSGVHIVTGKS